MTVKELTEFAMTPSTRVYLREVTSRIGFTNHLYGGPVRTIPKRFLEYECNKLDSGFKDIDTIVIYCRKPENCDANIILRTNARKSLVDVVNEDLLDDSIVNARIIQNKMIWLMSIKNHDYGNAFNKGCDAIGSTYAMSRIWDKCSRLESLIKSKSGPLVEDETLDDTISDLANYCTMYLAWKSGKKKNNNSVDGVLLFDISKSIKDGDVNIKEADNDVTDAMISQIDAGCKYYTNHDYSELYYKENDSECINKCESKLGEITFIFPLTKKDNDKSNKH